MCHSHNKGGRGLSGRHPVSVREAQAPQWLVLSGWVCGGSEGSDCGVCRGAGTDLVSAVSAGPHESSTGLQPGVPGGVGVWQRLPLAVVTL